MKNLALYTVSKIDELAWPEKKEELSLRSPALSFFTDFLDTTPRVIESSVSVIDVKKLMQKTHVRLKIVIDEKKHFLGVISDDDITDRKVVQKVSEGAQRDEITVEELMMPKRDLKALNYDEISTSTIEQVIAALKNSGQRHCLVIDRDQDKIRGIFSASDISRNLCLDIDIQDKPSFSKVFFATN